MASFKERCVEYFGTDDIYEILGVERDATEKEIKKAYHKLSLLVHPDRVDDSKKALSTEKFKVLGKIHAILHDKEKRKIYDDYGEIDEETDSSFNWIDYWRAIFKKIDVKVIEEYEKNYIGSETELRDIKKAYVASKGNMDLILEMVPFSNCANEPRIIEIVRKMVDDGEVEEYPGFFNEPAAKKARRKKKEDKEKKVAEKINRQTLDQEIKLNNERRLKGFADMISDLEAKYGGAKKRKSLTDGQKTTPVKKRKARK
ncbi:J domain-containing protein CG6693-like Protein [Tribolium castaneum]|uniref:J domain-containing protein CG6693-like Protein n=1 Tax=Tribolium castaneum TaxID=7070 RepID=D6WCL8_TRICA|nr:PREDICTED: J domain-containing protein CG6693 [Tribolium castaneum]EEZ98799.1 J domain-containing protein CG6693-like Protein [Tribolium castaneum]|eukprot:XP_966793.1 PREDICTED: J domain-containing protein CG6693 [Tribolium castaneum]